MTISEPTTMVTDYVLGAVSTVLGLRLLLQGIRDRCKSVAVWAVGFLATAIGAFIGGTYHGLLEALGTQAGTLWTMTGYSLGVTGLAILTGSIFARLPLRYQRPALVAAALKFLLFLCWTSRHDEFRYFIADYLLAMGVVLVLHARSLLQSSGHDKADLRIIGGILLSLGGAILQQTGVSPHAMFNHNDLFHSIQITAMFLFYTGARRLQDRLA